MSDPILGQILNQLQQMDKRFDSIDVRLEKMEDRLNTMESRLDTIEEQTKNIPLLQQAVLETLTITKHLDASHSVSERKVTTELNTHQHSIDILNRRQLRMEADIETLKSR
ncbi:hypothetical protein EL84_29765 [Paenibacillus sp. VT-400]|uniref:hypothetical protein n=1 Tax=Paenibacillus TaxID=44249 RepID=UPI00064AB72B|nr:MULTISPECIES: hypothetical protein [Paenibacillus]KLU56142.1 hypothetical protein EL84_29765 [Paenibacillus sp. VT-400]MCP1422650.1 hypothetical protein [Paenibacillus xylanexedens]